MDYYCSKCNQRSSMMGHSAQDDQGWYYTCEEPEREAARLAAIEARIEAKERAELARLLKKYPEV